MTIECVPSEIAHTRREGGLFAVPGFRGAAVATGVKTLNGLDLAVIASDAPRTVAGVFTTNRCAAAPVDLCRTTLRTTDVVRSIVINSGNANALTGARGVDDARAMQQRLERACGGPGLVLSTGVIGVPLPVERVLDGIDRAAARLDTDAEDDVARAMLTTDSRRKKAARSIEGTSYTVGGLAKGSGMIHPRMATMLGVVATDAPVGPERLRTMLGAAVDHSFHCISVDGDTSTNDAVILLAQPPGPGAPEVSGAVADAVADGVASVCRSLAEQIVRDGEGVNRTMEIEVRGAAEDATARRLAESIARSTLVKTALAGADPNWGRILSAAGAAGIDIDPQTCTLVLGDETVFTRGEVCDGDVERRKAAFAGDHVSVTLTVGPGPGHGRMVTTDLSKRYIEINSEYTT